MPRIVDNADIYASQRVGIFFPASSNGTSQDGDLTGQCVTLNKWFLAEMTDVPAPFSARGDARYVGRTLVNQGHAIEIPAGQQRRGDFVVYEYGQYGHIGVLLSGNRLFQENVNTAGATRRWVDGAWVYSATIVPVYASLGGVAPKYYRIKSYTEKGQTNQGGNEMIPDADNYYWRWAQKAAMQIQNRELSRAEFRQWMVGQSGTRALEVLSDDPAADRAQGWQVLGKRAAEGNWEGKINQLQTALNGSVSKADLDAAKKLADELKTQLAQAKTENETRIAEKNALNEKIAQYEAREQADKEAGDSFLRRIGQFISKYIGGK